MAKDTKEEQEKPKKKTPSKPSKNKETKSAKKPDSKEKRIEKLEEKLKAEKENFLRLFAEFENYKKRTSKERLELIETAGKDIIISFLPILDDFERALKQMADNSSEDPLYKGVELIHNKFSETLKLKGLKVMETEIGSSFDAEIHEAISQISVSDKEMQGKIVDVIEKGYKLGYDIVRYPKVVTGK